MVEHHYFYVRARLIDWCITPTSAIFQLYHCVCKSKEFVLMQKKYNIEDIFSSCIRYIQSV